MSFAPLVTWTPEDGHRLATEEERAPWLIAPSTTVSTSSRRTRVTRRLSCSDPCDQREIWRQAARALGATKEQATAAILVYIGGGWWSLIDLLSADLYDFKPRMWWGCNGNEGQIARATEALCLHCWGPK